jgi:hypothetical protein
MVAFFNQPGNHTPGNEMICTDIDHATAEGPVLAGSPRRDEPSPTPPQLSARPPGIKPYRRSVKRGEVRLRLSVAAGGLRALRA